MLKANVGRSTKRAAASERGKILIGYFLKKRQKYPIRNELGRLFSASWLNF